MVQFQREDSDLIKDPFKKVFISTIESIRLQLQKDKEYADSIAKTFNIDDVPTYDNSLLIKSLVSLLQIRFPKKGEFCEIEHYMYDLNFGKIGDDELITIDNLWDQLNREPMISTHPLIDDQTGFFSTMK